MSWKSRIRLKHFLTEREDTESVRTSMALIADALKEHPAFKRFPVTRFYQIPEGDDVIGALEYANKLIERMYDFADRERIWIE